MVKFRRSGSEIEVVKQGATIGVIRRARICERSAWGNIIFQRASGRIDRHHSLADAKADAAKS